MMRSIYLPLLFTVFISCKEQEQKQDETKTQQIIAPALGDTVTEAGKEIRDVFRDSKNNLWLASNGEGVFKYDGHTLLRFTEKQGLCSNYVWNIAEGRDGKIWFRTRDAVCFFNGSNFITQPLDEYTFRATGVNYLNSDLLAGYYYNGKSLVKIQLPETSPLKNVDNTKFHYDIYCTFKDSKGNLWFGTCTAGVCKYDGKTYTWMDDKELAMPVRCIFEDKEGNIWIGNNGYGLFRYDGVHLTNFTKEQKLDNPGFREKMEGKEGTLARVWSVTDDNDGNLWIATIDAGVWMSNGKVLRNYTTKDGLGSESVWTIYKDKNGKLWFGTDGAGVYTFDGKRFSQFNLRASPEGC